MLILGITTMRTQIGKFISPASILMAGTISLTQLGKDILREASPSEITPPTITKPIRPDIKMRTAVPTTPPQVSRGIRPPPIKAIREEAATSEATTLTIYVSDILSF